MNRLEIEREKELRERDTWFQSKKAKGLKKAKKAEDGTGQGSSSSWWWEDGENSHDQDWHKQEEASCGPALHAEPGAHGVAPEPSARAAGSSENPMGDCDADGRQNEATKCDAHSSQLPTAAMRHDGSGQASGGTQRACKCSVISHLLCQRSS